MQKAVERHTPGTCPDRQATIEACHEAAAFVGAQAFRVLTDAVAHDTEYLFQIMDEIAFK